MPEALVAPVSGSKHGLEVAGATKILHCLSFNSSATTAHAKIGV